MICNTFLAFFLSSARVEQYHFLPENIHVLVDEESHCPTTNPSEPDTTAPSDGVHQHNPRLRPRIANFVSSTAIWVHR